MKARPMMDLSGRSFGMLHVIAEGFRDKHDMRRWICACRCGALLVVNQHKLKRQNGCVDCGRDKTTASTTHHGHTKGYAPSRTYQTWRCMLRRCYETTAVNYDRYGARGVTVCERWHQFEPFLADMGERPNEMTLDRIDPTKGYEPTNCRWADKYEQARNRRRRSRSSVGT